MEDKPHLLWLLGAINHRASNGVPPIIKRALGYTNIPSLTNLMWNLQGRNIILGGRWGEGGELVFRQLKAEAEKTLRER